MRRVFSLALALVLTLALASLIAIGCGGDEDGGEGSGGPALARYCELIAEGDRAGEEIFGDLESDPSATPEDFEAAEREFVRQNEGLLGDLAEAAPEEISQDADILLASLRARAGLGPDVDEADAAAAEARVQAFVKQNC